MRNGDKGATEVEHMDSAKSNNDVGAFLVNWNLRNLPGCNGSSPLPDVGIKGTVIGTYPIDGWRTYYVEVPKDGRKKDIVGRMISPEMRNTPWDEKRVVLLPDYQCSMDYDLRRLRSIVSGWSEIGIPDDVPCAALAVKCIGSWGDEGREAQTITLLLVWSDGTARLMTLDYAEGPIEDCCTPEWYTESSPLLSIEKALPRMEGTFDNLRWEGMWYSIFSIPACLGNGLDGSSGACDYPLWRHEWKYDEKPAFRLDLGRILSAVGYLFGVRTGWPAGAGEGGSGGLDRAGGEGASSMGLDAMGREGERPGGDSQAANRASESDGTEDGSAVHDVAAVAPRNARRQSGRARDVSGSHTVINASGGE